MLAWQVHLLEEERDYISSGECGTQVYSEFLASGPGGPPSESIGCDGVPGSGRDYDAQCGVCGGQDTFPIPAPKSAGMDNDAPFACCKPLFTVSGQNSPSVRAHSIDTYLYIHFPQGSR